MLRRKVHERLVEWKSRSGHLPLLVKGQRQVGKTFSIRAFGSENYGHVVYIDFARYPSACRLFSGDLDIVTLENVLASRFGDDSMVPGDTLLIFDEIQECPRARSSLKTFAEDGRFDVIASGSLIDVRGDESRSIIPVGYEEHLTMYGLDFEEFLWATGSRESMISEVRDAVRTATPISGSYYDVMDSRFRDFMLVGGMPAAVQAFVDSGSYKEARLVMDGIVATLKDDIGKYSSKTNRIKIEACFDSIPYQLSKSNKKFMYTDIGKGLDGDDDIVNGPGRSRGSRMASREYGDSLMWIERSGIGNYCYALNLPDFPPEEFVDLRRFKIYMSDTGMLMSRYAHRTRAAILDWDYSVRAGAIVENEVAECLMKGGFGLFYFSSTKGEGRMEIDFIVEMGDEIAAVEVKSGKDREAPSLGKISRIHPNVTRRIKLERSNIHVDDEAEHYPLFAAAFMGDMIPDKGGPEL